jgi:hypothetical protein
MKFLEIGETDTIGIFGKKFLYLFQYFTKIQRSFSKIDYLS